MEDGKLAGYNVTAGGSLGMNHGNVETFPRLADILGFIPADKVNAVGEAILTTQRDPTVTVPTAAMRVSNTPSRIAAWNGSRARWRNASGLTFAPAKSLQLHHYRRSPRLA